MILSNKIYFHPWGKRADSGSVDKLGSMVGEVEPMHVLV